MVENLSFGINPLTGGALSLDDCCANELVQEALKTVLENCCIDSYATLLERQRREKKQGDVRKQQRAKRYTNQGKPWTLMEDKKLQALYNDGYKTSHIARIFKRSPNAIQSRIKKLKEWG